MRLNKNYLPRIAIAVMLIMAICEVSFAQVYPVRTYGQRCDGNTCSYGYSQATSFCAGEVKKNHWVFVTAQHVIDGGRYSEIQIDGKWRKADHIYSRNTMTHGNTVPVNLPESVDLAFLGIVSSEKFDCFEVATNLPPIGTEVVVHGLTSGDKKLTLQTNFSLKGAMQSGDSGAPITCQNKVIGVHMGSTSHGTPEARTTYTNCVRIRTHMKRSMNWSPRCQPAAPVVITPKPDPISTPGWKPRDDGDLQKRLVELEKRLNELASRKPIATVLRGQPGKDGRDGKDGVDGKDGKDVDPAVLEKMLSHIEALNSRVGKLEPLLERKVVFMTETGKVTYNASLKPTDTLNIKTKFDDKGLNAKVANMESRLKELEPLLNRHFDIVDPEKKTRRTVIVKPTEAFVFDKNLLKNTNDGK